MYPQYDNIKDELHNAIYDSFSPKEFMKSWGDVVKKYEIEDSEWLTGLYEQREMWIPSYMKHMCLGRHENDSEGREYQRLLRWACSQDHKAV